MNKLSENGHCYARRDQLISTATGLLEVESPELEMTLDEMIRVEDVKLDGEDSREKIFAHVRELYPDATEKQLAAVLK